MQFGYRICEVEVLVFEVQNYLIAIWAWLS